MVAEGCQEEFAVHQRPYEDVRAWRCVVVWIRSGVGRRGIALWVSPCRRSMCTSTSIPGRGILDLIWPEAGEQEPMLTSPTTISSGDPNSFVPDDYAQVDVLVLR